VKDTTPGRKNAQGMAYSYLKQRIIGGQLTGGTSISPTEIGAFLGISRMPVREALFQLESEGLIRFGSNRRPIVTTLTPKQIMELFEIRIALEQLAVARAVPKLNAKSFADLTLHLGRMERAKADKRTWLELHDEFHDRIYAAADMPKLMEEIARLRESIRPYLLLYTSCFDDPEVPGFEHSALLNAFKECDPISAQMAIAQHIRTGASNLVYFLMNNQTPPQILVDTSTSVAPKPFRGIRAT
jgi:DNA-binding GntR family transcriptional regulator